MASGLGSRVGILNVDFGIWELRILGLESGVCLPCKNLKDCCIGFWIIGLTYLQHTHADIPA